MDQEAVEQLERERARLVSQQERLVNRNEEVIAAATGRALNDGEIRSITRRSGEVEAIQAAVDRIDSELSQPQPRQTSPHAGDPIGGLNGGRISVSRLSGGRRFQDLFGNRSVDPYEGRFSSLGELGIAVAGGGLDPRLMHIRAAAMGESTGVGGGFMVPTQFLSGVLDGALEDEAVRPRATVVPFEGGAANVAGFDYQDGTSGASANLTLRWAMEGGNLAEQTAKARELTVRPHKGSIYVRVSNECVTDAPRFDLQLRQAMRGAVAQGLDYAFLQGIGVGQPLGIIQAPGTITVSKESGQAANTLMLQNLAKMIARLRPGSFNRAVWMVHQTVLPLLYQMTVVIKNVAGTENVGGGSAAVTVDAEGNVRVYGRPVIVSDACSALSSLGDIVLADWTGYLIGMRMDATIAADTSKHFDTDEVAFRMILRLDGMPINSTPVKLRNGTDTVSHFVMLEAR